MNLFTLENDLKQVHNEDSFCLIRSYIIYATTFLFAYSFVLQAIHRYVTAVYPTRLFWQSAKCQALFIGVTWIVSFIFSLVFLFTDETSYSIDDQICLTPLRLSFPVMYSIISSFLIPMSMVMFIYLKLILYVKDLNKRAAAANTLSRAKRELKMIQRTVKLISILMIMGTPYALFILLSFFNWRPKYPYRIILLFTSMSSLLLTIALFLFTDPLKEAVVKRINGRQNVVVAVII